MQSDIDVLPLWFTYLPVGQRLHDSDPANEYDPSLHKSQPAILVTAVLDEYLPAGHTTQVEWSSAPYLPAGQ